MAEGKADDKAPDSVTIPKKDLDDLRAAIQGSKDEIASLKTRLDLTVEHKSDDKQVIPPTPEKPPVRTVTKEMIAEANQAGDYMKGAELSERMAKEMADEVAFNFRKTHLEPANEMMLGRFEEDALASISSKKHYKRYEAQIQKVLAQIAPQFRARKDVVKACYERVIGEHAEELEKEAGEAAVRQAADAGGGVGPEGAGRHGGGTMGGGTSIEQAYGEDGAKDVIRILKSEGLTIDQFVVEQRRRGLTKAKNTEEYLQQVKASREEGAAV
jgi:hypothetical protein